MRQGMFTYVIDELNFTGQFTHHCYPRISQLSGTSEGNPVAVAVCTGNTERNLKRGGHGRAP